MSFNRILARQSSRLILRGVRSANYLEKCISASPRVCAADKTDCWRVLIFFSLFLYFFAFYLMPSFSPYLSLSRSSRFLLISLLSEFSKYFFFILICSNTFSLRFFYSYLIGFSCFVFIFLELKLESTLSKRLVFIVQIFCFLSYT